MYVSNVGPSNTSIKLATSRGLGYGKLIIKKSIAQAPPNIPIHISAQEHLKTFYESLGFSQTGRGYLEDGIPHIPMAILPTQPIA
jgi:ElaA protein